MFNKKYITELFQKNRTEKLIKLLQDNINIWSYANYEYVFRMSLCGEYRGKINYRIFEYILDILINHGIDCKKIIYELRRDNDYFLHTNNIFIFANYNGLNLDFMKYFLFKMDLPDINSTHTKSFYGFKNDSIEIIKFILSFEMRYHMSVCRINDGYDCGTFVTNDIQESYNNMLEKSCTYRYGKVKRNKKYRYHKYYKRVEKYALLNRNVISLIDIKTVISYDEYDYGRDTGEININHHYTNINYDDLISMFHVLDEYYNIYDSYANVIYLGLMCNCEDTRIIDYFLSYQISNRGIDIQYCQGFKLMNELDNVIIDEYISSLIYDNKLNIDIIRNMYFNSKYNRIDYLFDIRFNRKKR